MCVQRLQPVEVYAGHDRGSAADRRRLDKSYNPGVRIFREDNQPVLAFFKPSGYVRRDIWGHNGPTLLVFQTAFERPSESEGPHAVFAGRCNDELIGNRGPRWKGNAGGDAAREKPSRNKVGMPHIEAEMTF